MTKKPHLIDEDATLLDAAKKMQGLGCGILPVGTFNNIVGIITDRDIVVRAIANRKELGKTLVKNIMTKIVFFCEEHMLLQAAIQQMLQHKMRRVLVKNKDDQLCGILSLGDIVQRVHDKALLAELFKEK
jgi:CBS domain-containing protein